MRVGGVCVIDRLLVIALAKYCILDIFDLKIERLTAVCRIEKFLVFTHLKLWIASARHNFKWVKTLNRLLT